MRYCPFLVLFLACAADPRAGVAKTVYRVETVAGSSNPGDGGPAVAAQIGVIQGLAVDRFGNLYLSDTDNHRVRKVGSNGVITNLAGTGTAGFGGDGGPAASLTQSAVWPGGRSAATSTWPTSATSAFAASSDGTIITVAGTGQSGSAGDGGRATSAQLLAPRNVVLDAAGNLYIRNLKATGSARYRPAARSLQWPARSTDLAGMAAQPLRRSFASRPGWRSMPRTLYIADSQNQRIRKIVPGGTISTFLGGIRHGPVDAHCACGGRRRNNLCRRPQQHRARLHACRRLDKFAGTGNQGFAGDGGPAASAKLTAAHDLAVDTDGLLYIADGMRLRKVRRRSDANGGR